MFKSNWLIIAFALLIGTIISACLIAGTLYKVTCSVCDKETSLIKSNNVNCINGVRFCICEKCAWAMFKDKIKNE